jgi:hypothetical protein
MVTSRSGEGRAGDEVENDTRKPSLPKADVWIDDGLCGTGADCVGGARGGDGVKADGLTALVSPGSMTEVGLEICDCGTSVSISSSTISSAGAGIDRGLGKG